MLGLQREHLSAQASIVESDLLSTSARAAEENLRLIPNKETTEAVVERANVARDIELVRHCNMAEYSENMKIRAILSNKANRKQLGHITHTLRRS